VNQKKAPSNRIGLSFLAFKVSKALKTIDKIYFLRFFVSTFSTIEMVKLTKAPMVAKITVLIRSSEAMLGTILNTVPPAVPIKVGLFAVIFGRQLT